MLLKACNDYISQGDTWEVIASHHYTEVYHVCTSCGDWNWLKYPQMIPKYPGREKLMPMEGSFKKGGKASTCLCFKEKKQNVFCVMRWCQSSSTFNVTILTPNTEPSKPKLAFKKNDKLSKNSKSNCDREMMRWWKKKTPTLQSLFLRVFFFF